MNRYGWGIEEVGRLGSTSIGSDSHNVSAYNFHFGEFASCGYHQILSIGKRV